MATFYITPRGQDFNPTSDEKFSTFSQAKDRAEEIWANEGRHSHVIKVDTLWVTTTMADLMREGIARGDEHLI